MNPCPYCGRENENDALACNQCGQSLLPEEAGTLADFLNWRPQSSLGLTLTSGLAALLICTGLYFAAGRAMLAVFRIYDKDTDLPGMYDVVMFYPFSRPFLVIGGFAFILFVFSQLNGRRPHTVFAAVITSVLFAFMAYGPMLLPQSFFLLWLLPVILFGLGTNLSAGYYIGAALQILAGAWLLGWFKRKKTDDETRAVVPRF